MACHWGYKRDNGPHTWAVQFPLAAGHGQSPIDIVTGDLVFDYYIAAVPLKISYVEEEAYEATNTGESFKVDISNVSELQGGPLKDTFRLAQFHLHWGSEDSHGSEHTIDGQTYAAELHLVHWNSTKYSSFGEAVDKPDGLAVLGVLIKSGAEHKGFRDLVDTMKSVPHKGNTCRVLKAFDPTCLLPEDTKKYYTYHGSLTTPPCYESVQWIVFSTPVEFSPNQLQSLRGLVNDTTGDECIVDNFRPPMPLGDRKVRASFDVGPGIKM